MWYNYLCHPCTFVSAGMVHSCVVPGCNSRSNKAECKGIKFYNLPTTKKILQVWLLLIGRRLVEVNVHSRICSKHFIYKNHNTLKALVSITPSGAISFVSKLYGGSISDRELFLQSGLLDLLEIGDSVMADRGFTIADVLDARGVTLNIPPTKVNDQLSASELITTRRITALRIHVERAIGKIKNFKILDGIPNSMNGIVDQIFFVCCMLCNFSTPV